MKRSSGRIILLVLLSVLAAAPAPAADDAGRGKKELRRIEREMSEKRRELKRADRRERSILTELEAIDRDIQSGGSELAEQQRRLRQAETELRELEQSGADMSRGLERLRSLYGTRLRALYKMKKSGGYALAVLFSDDISAAAKRIKYLGSVAERDQRLIRQYGDSLERLSLQRAGIRERSREALSRKQAVEARRTDLALRRQRKAELLASVRQRKGVYEETLRELEESSSALWAMIRKAEQERKAAKVRTAPPRAAAAQAGRGRLPWPTGGQALTRFGVQRHPEFGTMVYRRGIDIEAKNGEEVRAVEEGQVAYADWYKGYGRLVILEHGPGFHTLYGHLSQAVVKAGDRVARGQVIGLAGDTGSLRGPRLYFEVRRNGEAEDPFLWLAKR